MASNVWVISSELKRTQIKVMPNTYLSDVLAEACTKFGINNDKFQLKHNQKLVDLSSQFRHAKLPSGAKLELVAKSKTPSAITVAVQLPQPEARELPGGRVIRKFPSDISLWQVMRQVEEGPASQGRNINLTSRGATENVTSGSGQLYYETPVLNIMDRELSTFDDFQKTLSQLGYNSGNVLIRLSFKKTGTPLFQAMEEINQKFKQAAVEEIATEKAAAEKAAGPKIDPVSEALEAAQPENPKDSTSTPADTLSEIPISTVTVPPEVTSSQSSSDSLQPITIFSAPTGNTPVSATIPFNEEDYTPTIAQLQAHQANLTSRAQNKRLLSNAELAAETAKKSAKISQAKSLTTKVRFPDNTSAQWIWTPGSTGAMLHQAIRKQMADPSLKFKLVLLPERKPITDDEKRLISDYKLTGGVIVTLLWDDSVAKDVRSKAFLNAEAAKNAKEIVVPLAKVAQEASKPKIIPAPAPKPKISKGGVPAWFKMGKR